MKKCPLWGGENPEDASRCGRCTVAFAQVARAAATPWYARTAVLVLAFLAVGPLALPLVWIHPAYSPRKKIILTVVLLAVTCVLGAVFLRAVHTILDHYRQIDLF